jgi:hypothetical protein
MQRRVIDKMFSPHLPAIVQLHHQVSSTRPTPHLHRDRARHRHICTATGRIAATSALGLGQTPPTSAPGPDAPLQHLHREPGTRLPRSGTRAALQLCLEMKGLEARAAVDAVVGLAELFVRNAPFLKISVRRIASPRPGVPLVTHRHWAHPLPTSAQRLGPAARRAGLGPPRPPHIFTRTGPSQPTSAPGMG